MAWLEDWQRATLHDLRTRLGTILVNAQLLAEDGTAPDTVGDLLQAAREARSLVQRLSIPPQAVPTDLDALVVEVSGGRVEGGKAGLVLADPGMVRNILTHLVHNAREAGSTQVVFRLGPGSVTVIDDGPGLAPEVAERLFQTPVSSKGEGRGEGLYTTRRLLRGLGGDLRFEPPSTFVVVFACA
ncbi:MAG TPA: HAMP domain-containing sensor histidine kinase [Candidatus Xenobia bacterium]|jgi:signal transduction histidine kinase